MPVKDKRYLLDETPGTNLPAQPPLVGVWNLFVSNSSFIHAAYQFRSTRRLRVVVKGLSRRIKAIAGFLLAVYRLDVFKRIVYTFCPMVELVAKQSSICIWSHFWLLWRVLFLLLKCQTSVPFLCLPLSFRLRPNSCFVLLNLTTESFPSFIGKGAVVFQSHFWVV